MTTFEPGASEVFTHGLDRSPRATALRASMPAPTITDGLEVLVQLVIAAITTCAVVELEVSPVGERCALRRARAPRSPSPTGLRVVPRLATAVGAVAGHAVGRRVRGGIALRGGLVVARRRRARSRRARRGRTRCAAVSGIAVLRALGPGERGLDRRRGRARCVSREGRLARSARRATGPAPWRRPRPARSARSGGPVRRR